MARLTDSPARSAPLVVGLVTLLLSAGCGGPGTGQGLDENGDPLTTTAQTTPAAPAGGAAASGNPNATLTWVQTNVFGGICAQCHIGGGAPLGLDWSTQAHTCANVRPVPRLSSEIPTMHEIESGNPAASYMIWKVQGAGPNGEPIVGGQMPLGQTPLPAATIKNLRDWIADGAPGC